MAKKAPEKIMVDDIKRSVLKVTVKSIEGSSLLMNRLAPEAVASINNKEKGKTGSKKKRDFEKEYQNRFHKNGNDDPVLPANYFIASCLSAITDVENLSKAQFKRSVRFIGSSYPFRYKKHNKHVEMVRRRGRNSAPDERWRPEFHDWECDLTIEYDKDIITANSIINLLNRAGWACGIGDNRPNSPKCQGFHGMFEMKGTK